MDTQKIFDYLTSNGMTYTKNIRKADLIVVSSCGNTQHNQDQSVSWVKECSEIKKKDAKIIIVGCLPKTNPDAYKGLDYWHMVPPRELDKLDDILEANVKFQDIPEPNEIRDYRICVSAAKKFISKFKFNKDLPRKVAGKIKRIVTGQRGISYNHPLFDYLTKDVFHIKIADGCLGNCAYCSIKFATGELASKPMTEVLNEFKDGLSKGYKKFSLMAEDVGCYGLDINTNIAALLKGIFDIKGDYSVMIYDFNAQWLVQDCPKLEALFVENASRIGCLTVPVQSGSNRILKLMNRPYDIEDVKRCLKQLRTKAPSLIINTHIMAGFPGETEEDFEKTKEFIKDTGLFFIYIFPYSDRPGTKAAKLPGKIEKKIMDKRVAELVCIQNNLTKEWNKSRNSTYVEHVD